MKNNTHVSALVLAVVAATLIFTIADSVVADQQGNLGFTGLYCFRSTNAAGEFDDFRMIEINRGGTLSSFVSTQGERAFLGQKGVWARDGNNGLYGTVLNFFHADPLNPVLTRGDLSMTCNDNLCNEISGILNLDFGDDGTLDLIQNMVGKRVVPGVGQGETGCSESNGVHF